MTIIRKGVLAQLILEVINIITHLQYFCGCKPNFISIYYAESKAWLIKGIKDVKDWNMPSQICLFVIRITLN